MTRKEAADFLLERPVELGHALGFTKLTDLHNRWIIDMVISKDDRTLQGHRGSYKTTCLSIALAVIMVLLPNYRIMFLRKTDDDVKEVIDQVSKILRSPQMQVLSTAIYGFPVKLVVDSANELSTNLVTDIKGTVQLLGLGIKSSMTGKHFDLIFTDDIVNKDDRVSRAEREKTKTTYQELQNVKNRGGRIYNTGTPWHKDDAFALMPTPIRFDCYSTGLISEEELKDIKSKMLPSLFAANYELRHIASEDVLFDSPVTGGDPSLVEQALRHVDASYGGSDSSAYTLCRRSGGKYYVYGRLWHRHIDDCKEDIISIGKRFNAGRILCEDNGDKGYLGRDLRNAGERVGIYHESENKFVKISSYLKPVWRDIVFVSGTDPEYIDQICDYNEHAEHDDAPDSLASLIREISKKKGDTEYVSLWGVK